MECIICKTQFKEDLYDSLGANKCPKCGQVYNYDETLVIELTTEQIECLLLLSEKIKVTHNRATMPDGEMR